MIHKAYSILDTAINVYGAPFVSQYEGLALRYFTSQANDPSSDIGRYPSQFHLFCVGEFDDATGAITGYPVPVSLGLASSYKE